MKDKKGPRERSEREGNICPAESGDTGAGRDYFNEAAMVLWAGEVLGGREWRLVWD